MSQIDEILGQLPVERIAAQLGADPAEVEQGARAALPALFGGLQANAMDPAGEASILDALQQHDPSLVEGGVDLDRVDPADGQAIAHHIFGPQEDEVVNRLGGVGGAGSGLVRKLIPILAPIVLSYLMGKLQQGGGFPGGMPGGQGGGFPGGQGGGQGGRDGGVLPGTRTTPADGGGPSGSGSVLQDVLGSVLGGAAEPRSGNTQAGGMPSSGSIITDILGGLLGGGRR